MYHNVHHSAKHHYRHLYMNNSGIQSNVSLADKNWFKTGGSARWYAEPSTSEAFQQVLSFAHTHNITTMLLGHGANVLISDTGVDGLIVRPSLVDITIHDKDGRSAFITAGAGVSMPELINFCLDRNLAGLEEFSGIPGTVGGSVYINLHYFEFLLEHFLHSAQVIHATTGDVITVDPAWFCFGYNKSRLQEREYYLISATFVMAKVSDVQAAYARGRQAEIMRHRAKRYPTAGTCGSFFRNFSEHEVINARDEKRVPFVAYYLDKVGVKGSLVSGGAHVSHQHANMIVNTGSATSDDIIAVARTMQQRVYDQFGIIPQPECQLIGFKEYPLL